MEKYYIFIDETGNPQLTDCQNNPFYTVTAVLMSEKVKEKVSLNLSALKSKYFGNKNYILHRNKIISALKYKNKNLTNFLEDLNPILNQSYFLFQVIVNKEKALSSGWDKSYVYKQTYRILLGNIAKFSIAREVQSIICTEASSVSQDINIYESFFHYVANGIDRLNIDPKTIKKHLTSLNFVTKLNNDAGEQLADLFSKTPINRYEVNYKNQPESSFNKLDLLLYEKSLTKSAKINIPASCNSLKKKIYSNINTFKIIP